MCVEPVTEEGGGWGVVQMVEEEGGWSECVLEEGMPQSGKEELQYC